MYIYNNVLFTVGPTRSVWLIDFLTSGLALEGILFLLTRGVTDVISYDKLSWVELSGVEEDAVVMSGRSRARLLYTCRLIVNFLTNLILRLLHHEGVKLHIFERWTGLIWWSVRTGAFKFLLPAVSTCLLTSHLKHINLLRDTLCRSWIISPSWERTISM